MIEVIFPAKENQNMSDEDWIDYCITVWCCNSLNAEAGNYRKKGSLYCRSAFKGAGSNYVFALWKGETI